jgi:hypothetical protein
MPAAPAPPLALGAPVPAVLPPLPIDAPLPAPPTVVPTLPGARLPVEAPLPVAGAPLLEPVAPMGVVPVPPFGLLVPVPSPFTPEPLSLLALHPVASNVAINALREQRAAVPTHLCLVIASSDTSLARGVRFLSRKSFIRSRVNQFT